jgi:TolA-binding protein
VKRLLPALLVLLTGLPGCTWLRHDEPPTIADLGNRPVRLEDQPLATNEQQAMHAYRDFLATDDQSAARPQAMRRLADINLEADAAVDTAPDASASAPASRQQAEDSIRLYRQVLHRYPDRPDNDSVLYQLARASELAGEPEQALASLSELVQRYPASAYRAEALFRRGEILFVRRQYAAAAQSYRSVVQVGAQGAFYEQALYKLGWCEFKQGRYDRGNATFLTLLDHKLGTRFGTPPAAPGRADQERLDDALRAMSLAFSYEQGPGSVTALFRMQGKRPWEDLVYERLGKLYLAKERYTDAAQTFQAFVDNNPQHAQAPAFQMRVIDAYQAGGFPSLVLQGKKDFVERYNLQSAYWKQHDRATSPQVQGFLKTCMTDLSRYYHAQAQQSKKPADYAEAARWYRSFLGSFPHSPEAPGMNFLLADLLYDAGNYHDAAQEYVHTAYDYGAHTRAAEAGYAAVLAYARAEEHLDGAQRTAWHRAGIEHAIRFATTFPQHPQALAVLSKTAEQLLALRENARAVQVAQRVTGNVAATPEQQRVCWTVQAHAWFDLHDYLHAEQAYQQALARTAASSKEKPVLVEKLAASIYKQGEAARKAGDLATAVAQFQRVRSAAPGSSIVATAQYDAAAGLLQQQQWRAAATALRDFRADYPDDPRQAEVTRRLATAYQQGDQPLQAAQEFARIGKGSGKDELRREALWQAADLYERAGATGQAQDVYRYYIAQFPHPAEAAIEARHHVAVQLQTAGRTREYTHWLQEIIDADRQAGAERTKRTRYLAAMAQLALADQVHERYRAVALRLPLKQTLATKKRLLQEALAQYKQGAAYSVAEVTTASAFHTAELYSELATAILRSERPHQLDAEALEEYNALLEDQAYPFEEQAIALYETNVARMKSGLYDAWIGRSLQALATLVPAKYAKQERGATYVAELR